MLDAFRVHASTDLEETQAFLAGKRLRIEPRDRAAASGAFSAAHNAGYGEDFYIAHMTYGTDVTIDAPGERADYGFSVPITGRMAMALGGETSACTRERTVLASPTAPNRIFVDGGAERLSLSLQQSAVRRQLACLTGESVNHDVEFHSTLDLASGAGRVILDAMELIVAAADRGDPVFNDPLKMSHFQELVLSSLLLYQPHSHVRMLERPCRAPASRDVRRAIDYIEAHLDAPVRLDDLARVAEVPGRTLNDHFHAFTGLAPMAYLRMARMNAVRKALLAGDASSVTDVAMAFGFMHMGRFAAAYAKAYGERPSATLARSRGPFDARSTTE